MNKSQSLRLVCGAIALSLAVWSSAGQSVPNPAQSAVKLEQLQGYWEGGGPGGKCSITITGDTLLYRAGTNWHKTTFTLPTGTTPQQLHATIKESWPPAKDAIGEVVHAIIKLEQRTLTIATVDITSDPAKTFDDITDKFILVKTEIPKPPAKDESARKSTSLPGLR